MSEFVEECRREWRRLRVPDPIANEMAADLTADLEEAEAEGGSPEDVLGNSAFDPQRFAAAWAQARGVAGPPLPGAQRSWRTPVAILAAVILGLIVVVAAVALAVGVRGHSFSMAVRRVAVSPGPMRIFGPGPGRSVRLGPPFMGAQFSGLDHPLALVVLAVGVLGVVGLGLVAAFFWSPWSGRRRDRQGRGPRTPSWS